MLVPVAALAPALALLAGCSSEPQTPPPPPKVDFTVAADTVTAKPFLYCNVEIEDCKRDTAAQVKLKAAPGTAVKVRVPKEIADTPWSVVIQYRDAAGVKLIQGESGPEAVTRGVWSAQVEPA